MIQLYWKNASSAVVGEDHGVTPAELANIEHKVMAAHAAVQQQIAAGKLERALADAKAKNPDIILELSADKSVSYGVIVGVVDAARVVGIRNITAFTKKSAQ